MKKDRKKKRILCNLERFMYKVFAVVILIFIVLIVCSETKLAQINVEVQKIDNEVDQQKKKIESLEMKINEMTSLEHIKEICEEYGLVYRSDNIKVIEKR